MAETTKKVNELEQKSAVNLTDKLLMIGDSEEYQALVSAVAKRIVEDYAGSSLGGSSRSVKDALDSLNSKWGDKTTASGTASDANELTASGIFLVSANTLNLPGNWGSAYGSIEVIRSTSSNYCKQTAFKNGSSFSYERYKTSGSGDWSEWVKISREKTVYRDAIYASNLPKTFNLTAWKNYILVLGSYGSSGGTGNGSAAWMLTAATGGSGSGVGITKIFQGSNFSDSVEITTDGLDVTLSLKSGYSSVYRVMTLTEL